MCSEGPHRVVTSGMEISISYTEKSIVAVNWPQDMSFPSPMYVTETLEKGFSSIKEHILRDL